ncbi:MAG TPA: branched-chain amino acid ABC transporter permease [Pyrinomonadaceae bacterium]|nr:branched-chain amino acid ABC transporter permease [Pyrinomonadaceae bacterium]
MEYLLHILIVINIYLMAAVSLNLIAGYMGMLSLAHASFFGLGAYVSALSAVYLQTGFITNLGLSIVAALLLSGVIAISSIRLRDDYFVIATFGCQAIFYSVVNNWIEMTNGPLGISFTDQPIILGWRVATRFDFLILTSVFAAIAVAFAYRLTASPFGKVLQAIREDEVFAKTLGKDVKRFKVITFISAAATVSVAGSLYAYYFTYIDPTSFTVQESILMLAMVIVGGAGRVVSSIVGAVLLIAVPEILRVSVVSSSAAPHVRQILYGLLLVLFMMFRPQGIAGRLSFRKN